MKKTLWSLLTDSDSLRFWDIDGVLMLYELGNRNHNACKEAEWSTFLSSNPHFYVDHIKPVRLFQDFIKQYGNDNDYTLSVMLSDLEYSYKQDFIKAFYTIDPANVLRAQSNPGKLDVIRTVLQFTGKQDIAPEKIIMIDDNQSVLTYIQENSDYTTVHISSFLDDCVYRFMEKEKQV